MSEKNVIVDRVFAADNHTVWRALTENDLMKQWYFDLAEFRPEVGFKFEFLAGDEAGKQWKHVCEVTEVVLEKKLVHTWTYEGYSGVSYVTWELFADGESTRLKLTHSGIETFPGEVPDLAIHNFEKDWDHIVNISLKEFLEKE